VRQKPKKQKIEFQRTQKCLKRFNKFMQNIFNINKKKQKSHFGLKIIFSRRFDRLEAAIIK
jgi:hypothetical protein